ncbi:response regulator receiver protein [Candidatus Magnetoovum chiemensis]|nr:response regulator receiver protein [Candidatus Magnetoovum chiemensis]
MIMSDEIKANVLIVDDETNFLDLVSTRLETRGLKVEKATNGTEALDKVKQKSFDAIVLDLAMPGMDGHETLKALKKENPDLQVIILTGHATVHDGVEVIKEGAIDLLEKPLDLNQLINKIGQAKLNKVVLIEKHHEDHIKEIMKSKGW